MAQETSVRFSLKLLTQHKLNEQRVSFDVVTFEELSGFHAAVFAALRSNSAPASPDTMLARGTKSFQFGLQLQRCSHGPMTDVSELSLQNSTSCENGRNMTCRFECNGAPVILLLSRGDYGRHPVASWALSGRPAAPAPSPASS